MQTLLQALEAAASKFKPALVPAHCSLQYNKKPVDLNTPFRLLNVPAGSKLEVLIYSEWLNCTNQSNCASLSICTSPAKCVCASLHKLPDADTFKPDQA
jgi:hypothetical protein